MKRYSIIHVPVLSFFSKDLYRDVALQWKCTGLGYLFLLLVIAWIPVMVGLHVRMSEFVAKDAAKLIAQAPNLTIRDGKASITEPEPYFIKEPGTGEVIAIIDTTGKTTSLEGTTAVVLVTQTEAIVRKNKIETQNFSFHDIKEFHVGPAQVKEWLSTLSRFAAPVLYPLALGGSYVFRIGQALIYAVIGLLFAALCHVRLGYVALLRLAVVAVTPCIIIETILHTAGVSFPFAGLWYFLITMGFLLYGVSAVAQAEIATPVSTLPPGGNEGR
jgi:hypothetical protein